jgi:hypothetical protein
MLTSGALLFLSEATKCHYSPAFRVKMISLLLAILFTFLVRSKVTGTDEPSPLQSKRVALASVTLWSAVGVGGRWIWVLLRTVISCCRPGARSGRAEKQFSPVRECHIPAVGFIRSILGLVTLDEDLCSRGQRIFGEPTPEERIGSSGFDYPGDDLAVGPFTSIWIQASGLIHSILATIPRNLTGF